MYRTFNMGIGLMAIVNADDVEDIAHLFKAHGEEVSIIGEITALGEDQEEVTLNF